MIKLCILYGGKSNEREVSISSMEWVLENISKDKYILETIDIPADGSCGWAKKIAENPPDVVLSALHGGNGENGAVQGFLECLNIPFVGSGVLSSALCMNKHMSKIIMEKVCIPCAEGRLIKSEADFACLEGLLAEYGLPVIIKPNNGGSSVGVVIAEDIESVKKACAGIFETGDHALVEKYYQGREVTCGIVDKGGKPEVLGVLDIIPATKFYDYDAKYVDENTYIGLSDLPGFVQNMIEEISKKAFIALDCRGYARLDMIVYNEQIAVIEMNTLPGLTAHSLIPKAAEHLSGGFSGFLDELISQAM